MPETKHTTAEVRAMTHSIDTERADRLAHIPKLGRGEHRSRVDGACIMEAVSYVAGEKWSDAPACACPVISGFLRTWNDGLSDTERDALLRPLILRVVGSRATPDIERRRSFMAADWVVRQHTPAWLRAAALTAPAEALAMLPEIIDMAQLPIIRDAIWAAKRDASAAGAAAWDAAGAARAAAWDAAWDAQSAAFRQLVTTGTLPAVEQRQEVAA